MSDLNPFRLNKALLILCVSITAATFAQFDTTYSRWVGDIEFDPKRDNENFELKNGDDGIKQYFNFGQGVHYDGEKPAIIESFNKNYKPLSKSKESGWIRIRFVVNYKGETDRFRLIASDFNYQAIEFSNELTDQLIRICKGLKGWNVLRMNNEALDYYQYLIFKIENGEIIEILP
jgi:hypothetical protein